QAYHLPTRGPEPHQHLTTGPQQLPDIWVRDRGERKLALVGQHVRGGGVKHYDLLDSRGGDFILAAGHRLQVQVADGTAGVAAELQVGEDAGSRQEDALRLDRRQFAGGDD